MMGTKPVKKKRGASETGRVGGEKRFKGRNGDLRRVRETPEEMDRRLRDAGFVPTSGDPEADSTATGTTPTEADEITLRTSLVSDQILTRLAGAVKEIGKEHPPHIVEDALYVALQFALASSSRTRGRKPEEALTDLARMFDTLDRGMGQETSAPDPTATTAPLAPLSPASPQT